MKYAIINTTNNIIENVIELDETMKDSFDIGQQKILVEVPETGNIVIGGTYIDGTWNIPTKEITLEELQAELNRRLTAGFNYDFGDERGIHIIGTTADDMNGWDEVTKYAQALINLQQLEVKIDILTDTGPVEVTAMEWQAILINANSFRKPIWMKYFALKAQSPIPQNYADNSHWT